MAAKPNIIKIPANGWKPRGYQMASWRAWERGIKRHCLCWHRRAGKDEVALNIAAVASHLRPANYWHCLPQFTSARRAIWEAVNPHTGKKRIDEAFPKVLRKTTREDTMTIEFLSGSVWRVVGSDDPDSLVGAPPAGIVFSEWALSNPSAWGYLAPILDENNGWAFFIATPRGRNHFKQMLDMAKASPDWFAEVLTVNDTGYPIDRVDKQREEYHGIFGVEAGDALIDQEYYCSFEAAILGAYYGREMVAAESRICEVKPWPGCPVHSAWDLGVSRGNDTMTIGLWQIVPGERGKGQVRVLDALTGAGYSIQHYAGELRRKRLAIADALGQTYEETAGTDYVPHDAKVPEMTSSGHDGRAKLRIEVMIENGLKPKIITLHHVSDGISAVRQMLPRCWFDRDKTEKTLVEGLRQYQREWDDDLKTFKQTALANWAAHWADMVRYMAMAFREIIPKPMPAEQRMLVVGASDKTPGQVSLNDLWKLQPAKRRKRI